MQEVIALAVGIALPCLIFMHVQRSLQQRYARTARHLGSAIRNQLASRRHGHRDLVKLPAQASDRLRTRLIGKPGGQSAIASFGLALSIEQLHPQSSDALSGFPISEPAHMYLAP